ncbi:hypothetical protein DFH09DRAFT_1420602 [Mycena vulgaris]|nr:hypothetical protein DFH09DRAFT_1420602 [Mycena vulgaris]
MRTFLTLFLLAFGQLTSRASAANGTCISSPQSACTSLVAICVSKIATGQAASNNFWSVPECFAGATCAGPAAVLDAACCAGTCVTLANMHSLDYNAIYAPMVGSCAFASGGCPVTWTDFVNYFYNTIQATNTNNWPLAGDDVLRWWSDIATWTAFCSGTSCVNGQIPYLNLDDWLRFSSATLITTPGNPPIHDPLSSDRDNNTNIWDPTADAPCPFTDQTLCFEDNGPQEPPDATNSLVSRDTPIQPRSIKLATLSLKFSHGPTSFISSSTKFLPANIPPPVYITNGTQKVLVDLNLSGGDPPARRQYSLVDKRVQVNPSSVSLEKRPVVRSDVCKGTIDTPSPLPVLTYYCDYMPHICASIRGSGFLSNDEIVLTYDAFTNGKRRTSLCPATVNAEFRESGGCDRRQHDPLYWLISCDEFPMNSVLEGGKANGAIVNAVPEREQQFQGSLHTAVSKLLRLENDARSQWSKPRNVKQTYAGQCHKFTLKLVDARPVGASPLAIGTLFTGGAFMYNNAAQHTETLIDSRAGPPPPARLTPYNYPADAIALKPTGSYKAFDCRPCTIGAVPAAAQAALNAFNNVTRVVDLQVEAAAASCTKTNKPTSTPTPTSDAASNAAEAAVAAAAAQAALNSANESAAITAAAQTVVNTAKAAAIAAAAAAAAAIANNPAAMASAIASANVAQSAVQSAISTLTDIFGAGTIPAAIASIISQASIAASDASSVLTDTWNTKPPQSDPVPPDSDPVHSPTTNSGGGASVPAAACFGPGSSGKVTINGPYIWLSTGTATEGSTITDAGSPAYFGMTMANDGPYVLSSLCSGVYAWSNGDAQPSYQVACSSNELGSYWNAVKQQCYVFPFSSSTYGVVCANDVGRIYSCLQSQGYQSQITAVSFSWSS